VQVTTETISAHALWTDELCTVANGHTSPIRLRQPFELVAGHDAHIGDTAVLELRAPLSNAWRPHRRCPPTAINVMGRKMTPVACAAQVGVAVQRRSCQALW
jgi:hypothetical protein